MIGVQRQVTGYHKIDRRFAGIEVIGYFAELECGHKAPLEPMRYPPQPGPVPAGILGHRYIDCPFCTWLRDYRPQLALPPAPPVPPKAWEIGTRVEERAAPSVTFFDVMPNTVGEGQLTEDDLVAAQRAMYGMRTGAAKRIPEPELTSLGDLIEKPGRTLVVKAKLGYEAKLDELREIAKHNGFEVWIVK